MRQNSQKSFANIKGLQLNDSLPKMVETLSKSCERTVIRSNKVVTANCMLFERHKNEGYEESHNRVNIFCFL